MTEKKIPMRQCVGCREMKPKRELIRVVTGPDGETHLDLTGKANGRGSYLCPREECLKRAVKNKCFREDILEQLKAELEARDG